MTSNMTETEIKLRWEGDAASARARIEARGYRASGPRLLESDQLFDRGAADLYQSDSHQGELHPGELGQGELRQKGCALRLRISGEKATVTYKGPVAEGPYKSREEIEFDVSDPRTFELVFARLGYQRVFRYEKFRTKFRAIEEPGGNQGEITLDETPIGIFLELEGPGYWIDATAEALGFSREKFLTASYAALYGEYRKTRAGAPSDMIFGAKNP